MTGAPPLDWWNLPWEEVRDRLIKAMCPEKVCRTCGEPSRRITDVTYDSDAPSAWGGRGEWSGPRPTPTEQRAENYAEATAGQNPSAQTFAHGRAAKIVNTIGWSDCGHDNWRAGLVLDPFAGSGTTLAVATGHGRDAIGIDLDVRNYQLALERVGPLILQRGEVAA